MLTGQLLQQVSDAMEHQHKKFGHKPLASNMQFLSILGEEYGEVCRGINQGNRQAAEKEAIQCVAVCIAWLQDDLHFGEEV